MEPQNKNKMKFGFWARFRTIPLVIFVVVAIAWIIYFRFMYPSIYANWSTWEGSNWTLIFPDFTHKAFGIGGAATLIFAVIWSFTNDE